MKRIILTLVLVMGVSIVHAATLNNPAPAFTLRNSHQQKRSLADYKGKVVFINFWASWCAPCQLELPEISRLAAAYTGKKVKVVAINVDEEREAAKKLLGKLGLTASEAEILWDNRSTVVSNYNIEAMPSSLVIDAKGVIRHIHAGFHEHDPETWRKEIDQLIP